MSGRHDDDDHLRGNGNRQPSLPADIGMTGLETEL